MNKYPIKKLSEICKKASSNISQNQLSDNDGEFPIYGASGLIKNVDFYHQENEYIWIVKDGAGIGRITLLPEKSSVIGTLQYILPQEWVSIRFLYYSLLSIDFLKYKQGSTIPHIYFKDYSQEEIVVPPLDEQLHIVSIIDEQLEKLNQAKENIEKNLQNAKDIFESYLQNIFANPWDNWEEKQIQEITKLINGYAFGSKDFKPTNSIKSIKITNVGVKEFVEECDNYLPETFKETFREFSVRRNNIVIALTRTIIAAGLKVAIVPESYDGALLNQRVAALIPIEELVDQRYLYYYLLTEGVSKYVLANVNTLMQPNLSINDLKKLTIPCPLLITQKSIVSQLDTLSIETKRLESIYQQKLAHLEDLRKSLLQKAFNGEL